MKNLVRSLVLSALALSFAGLAHADTAALTSFSGGFLANSGSDQLYGWIFTVNDAVDVTALGVYDVGGAAGLSIAHNVGIYDDSSEALLTSATVPAGPPATLINGFDYVSITPLALTAGDEYVIVMTMPDGNADTQWIETSTPTTASQITWDNSDFGTTSGSTLAFPTIPGAFAPGMFGPNFLIASATTPEPASYGLFGLGILAMAGLEFVRRRKSAAGIFIG